MKVFISWSGSKSKETAEVLSSWIRQVIQAAETWISLDIDKGARGNEIISKELEQAKVGIICLNKENLTSEWILFEAGALSKTSDAYVCTFLLDVNPADIKPPLGQFQYTTFVKEEVLKLIHTINNKIKDCAEKTIPEKDLDEVFEIFWPKLKEKLEIIKNASNNTNEQRRVDRDILEEILQVVRGINPSEKDSLTNDLLLRNKDLEKFVYMVSHNLRTPIANIMGLSTFLKDKTIEPSEKEDYIEHMLKSVQQIEKIVKNLNGAVQINSSLNKSFIEYEFKS